MTLRFELTDAGGTDYAVNIISMDGVDIIVYFAHLQNEYMFNGCKINGIDFEAEDEVKGLFVRIGQGFVYNLHSLADIIAEASEQIEDIVIEAKEAEEREE